MYCSIMTIHSTVISLNFGFWYGCDAALVYFFVVNYACYDLVCTPDIHFVPSAPIFQHSVYIYLGYRFPHPIAKDTVGWKFGLPY